MPLFEGPVTLQEEKCEHAGGHSVISCFCSGNTEQKVTLHGTGWDTRGQRNLSDWFPHDSTALPTYLLTDERKITLAGQTGRLWWLREALTHLLRNRDIVITEER